MKIIINLLIGLIISIPMFAQTEYYYFKGQRIPLTVNPKKVNVISKATGPQFAPAVNPNALPAGLEVEAVIPGNPYNMCIIKNNTSNVALLNNYLNSIVNPNYNIVQTCYYSPKGIELIPSGYIYIKLKRQSDTYLLSNIAQTYGLTIDHQNIFMPLWYVLYITRDSAVSISKILNELGVFDVVEPDLHYSYLQPFNSISWDENVSQQWGLYNATNDAIDINASSAWNYATGKGVYVGVFDTGIDHNHPDLADNLTSLVYDTYTNDDVYAMYGLSGHGTHVAGIISAIRNNGIFSSGVAPDANLVSISSKLSLYLELATENLANGFNWAVQNGIDVINCSWHWRESELLCDAIDNAIQSGRNGKGCIVIFAAGNDSLSQVSFPANYKSEILAVGSVNKYGTRSDFSNYGSGLDVVAPGDTILSTLPNSDVGFKRGTSMAAPHVSGIAALILELNPDLTGQQVRDIIEQSTIKVGDIEYTNTLNRPNGTWNEYYGYGLVDALKAVQNTPRKQIDY